MSLGPHGGIRDGSIKPPGISPRKLNVLAPVFVGYPKASGTALVFTTAGVGTPSTATYAPGTNVDYARNLLYQMSVSGGSAVSASFGGSLYAIGSDIKSKTIAESVALSNIVSAGTDGIVGTKCFASIASTGLSLSAYSLASGYSSRSASISFYVGIGNIIGMPQSVRSSNFAARVQLGTDNQVGSFTVKTGDIPTAGISLSNAVGTGSLLIVSAFLNR